MWGCDGIGPECFRPLVSRFSPYSARAKGERRKKLALETTSFSHPIPPPSPGFYSLPIWLGLCGPCVFLVSGVLSASPAIFKPSRRCASILSRLVRRVLSAFALSLSLSLAPLAPLAPRSLPTRLKTLPSDIFLGCFSLPARRVPAYRSSTFAPHTGKPKVYATDRACLCVCVSCVCECVLCVYTAAAENLLTPLLLPSSLSLSLV